MESDIIYERPRKSKKWLLIIPIIIVLIIGVIFLVASLSPKETDKIKVINSESLGLRSDKLNEFKIYLAQLLQDQGYIAEGEEIPDVEIRDGTVESFTSKDSTSKTMTTTSFLIDIDSVKQTFRVKVYDYTGTLTDMPVIITCPQSDETKYPSSECKGHYGATSKSVRNNLPHEMDLATGEKVLIKTIDSTADGQQLIQVYLYSCDAVEPPIEAASSAARAWVSTLDDPIAEYYSYNIRPGYCEGDTI